MLAIESIANDTLTEGINTNLCITSVDIIDNKTIRLWFSKPIINGDVITNFNATGIVNKTVVMTQYEIEYINGSPVDSRRGIRLYFDSDFIVGQWTINIISFLDRGTSILSHLGGETQALPIFSSIILDLIDRTETNLDTVDENSCRNFIPKKINFKKNYDGMIAGIDAGDKLIQEQVRETFDQMSLASATESFLTTRAHDVGIDRPYKIGMNDSKFRKLSVDVINDKLTSNALLNVLETIYGIDSVSSYVESIIKEPYEIYNSGTLDLLIDGKDNVHFIANTEDFTVPLRATADELACNLNLFFNKNNIKAFSSTKNSKLRIYSKTKGNRSSIKITGGTLQPSVQLEGPAVDTFTPITPISSWDRNWVLSNPRVGIVRFADQNSVLDIRTIQVNDYVTIIGSEFPEDLRGCFKIIDVSYELDSGSPVYWFEIESDYIVSTVNTVQNLLCLESFSTPTGGYYIRFSWTNPTVSTPLTQLRLIIKKDTPPSNYNDSAYLIEDMPGGTYDFNSNSGATQSITRTVPSKGHWTITIMFIDSTGIIQEQVVYSKNYTVFEINYDH
jgi:hypothetical protein